MSIELLLPGMAQPEPRTWVEINGKAVNWNVRIFRRLIGPKTQLWAVVKSNAYGHGIFVMPQILSRAGVDGFCVDSIVEGVRLRELGIRQPILVLGLTLPSAFALARAHDVTVTVSNFPILEALIKTKNPPDFHLKLDTGMHRQGFYPEEVIKVVKALKKSGKAKSMTGIFTHFASAKDMNYPAYTDMQFKSFLKVCEGLKLAGFKNLIRHAGATAGAMIGPKYHLDAVRIGIGFYGLYPSKELEIQRGEIKLKPVLSWYTVIGETKKLKKGDYVGYDLAERVTRPTKMAVLPIGYWHGYPRALSGVGQVLIKGQRAKILGRVSMDMIVVDITGINCGLGDTVTLIGRDGPARITAQELAALSGASYYEILTRINPLIERIEVR